MPFSRFEVPESSISKFCNALVDRNITLFPGLLQDIVNGELGLISPGECEITPSDTAEGSKLGYNLAIALAFDRVGCAPDHQNSGGVDMKTYGADNCISSFQKHLLNNCKHLSLQRYPLSNLCTNFR